MIRRFCDACGREIQPSENSYRYSFESEKTLTDTTYPHICSDCDQVIKNAIKLIRRESRERDKDCKDI